MNEPLPLFGAKRAGVEYTPRPGAYAVVFDAEGRVAIVNEDGEWSLPGGGIEGEETPEQALVREVDEECACGVRIESPCGEALEFLESRSGRLLEVHARYFRAAFVGTPTASWLAPEEACARVRRQSDAWIIRSLAAGSRNERAGSSRLVDLSHTIHDGLVTYPGLPAPRIREHLARVASRRHYAPGTEFSIGSIEMVANTGTYLDAPFHRYEAGRDMAELPLESVADLPGIVLRAPHDARVIDAELFARVADARDLAGHAVLVDSGWSRHFGTPEYASGHPHLTRAAAELLAGLGVALVGIDSLNIDDTASGERPVHSLLLERDIRIVEHLTNLAALPGAGFRFFAVPAKVRGLGSFPVRAFARLGD